MGCMLGPTRRSLLHICITFLTACLILSAENASFVAPVPTVSGSLSATPLDQAGSVLSTLSAYLFCGPSPYLILIQVPLI